MLGTQCVICYPNPGQIKSITTIPLIDSIISGNLQYFWDSFVSLILPALTLSIGTIALLSRLLRSSMIDALSQDYIRLARSKGLRERAVVYRHALRNGMLPALTASGLVFSFLLGGVVVVEDVFSYPGIGQAALIATDVFDVNFLELYVLVVAVIIVVTNLIVDLVYAKINPRIRY